MNDQKREYIIGVFGKPTSQRPILAVDYKSASREARAAFPGESTFAVSADAVAFISHDDTPPKQPMRRKYRRR